MWWLLPVWAAGQAQRCADFACSSADDCARSYPCPYRYYQNGRAHAQPLPSAPYTKFDCQPDARCGHAHTSARFGVDYTPLLTVGATWRPETALHVENTVVAGNNNTLRNVTCPVLKVRSGTVRDLAIDCNNDEPAIVLDLVPTLAVTLNNVRVAGLRTLLSGVHPTGVKIASLTISNGSTGTVVLANLNPTGKITAVCRQKSDILVVAKQIASSLAVTTCSEVTLEDIVGILGTQYEMDYLYRNAELDPIDHLYRIGLTVLAGSVGVAFAWTVGTNGKALRELMLQHKIEETKEILTYFKNPLFAVPP